MGKSNLVFYNAEIYSKFIPKKNIESEILDGRFSDHMIMVAGLMRIFLSYRLLNP